MSISESIIKSLQQAIGGFNMMNGQHYATVKSICDWIQNLDVNGAWTDMYKEWDTMDNQERLTELAYLISTLNDYIKQEKDEVYLNSFNSALDSIMKIEKEILEDNNEQRNNNRMVSGL